MYVTFINEQFQYDTGKIDSCARMQKYSPTAISGFYRRVICHDNRMPYYLLGAPWVIEMAAFCFRYHDYWAMEIL